MSFNYDKINLQGISMTCITRKKGSTLEFPTFWFLAHPNAWRLSTRLLRNFCCDLTFSASRFIKGRREKEKSKQKSFCVGFFFMLDNMQKYWKNNESIQYFSQSIGK